LPPKHSPQRRTSTPRLKPFAVRIVRTPYEVIVEVQKPWGTYGLEPEPAARKKSLEEG